MRLFVLRKKGAELNQFVFERKGILQAVFQRFLSRYNWRKDNPSEYEVVELEFKVMRPFEIEDLKENIDTV